MITRGFDKNLLLSGLSILIMLVLLLLSKVYATWLFSGLAVIVFCFYILYLVKRWTIVLLPMLGFVFIKMTELISGLLIESGGYMTEVDIVGEVTGAYIRLPIYYVLFFFSVIWSYKKFSAKKQEASPVSAPDPKYLVLMLLFILLVVFSGAVSGVVSGFSLFEGSNRFSFRSHSGSSTLYFFLNNRFLTLVLLGSMFAFYSDVKEKAACVFGAVVVVLLSILHGEQFTAMISLFLAFFIAPLIFLSAQGRDIGKIVFSVGLSGGFLATFSVLLAYSQQGVDVLELVERRLVLQGQLWYVTDLHVDSLLGETGAFVRNIPSFFHLNVDHFIDPQVPFGMRELMYVYATSNIYEIYIENNVTFTMGQMAMLLYWFGYIGMVFFILLTGVLFGMVILYLNRAISRLDVISILLASKIFVWFVFGFQQGEYWYIFGAKTVLFCGAVYLFEKYRSSLGIAFLRRSC